MSAFSLQLRPNNETLFFIRAECSSTQLQSIRLYWHSFGKISKPVYFRRKISLDY